jgi:cytidine deaminase
MKTRLLENLVAAAIAAKHKALAPYSKFRVGAAVMTAEGKIFDGCNIESSSYGLTCCAERVSLFKALSEGEREFSHIAVAADTHDFCSPCGACRQVLWDYARNAQVILVNAEGDTKELPLARLLPEAFDDHLLSPR